MIYIESYKHHAITFLPIHLCLNLTIYMDSSVKYKDCYILHVYLCLLFRAYRPFSDHRIYLHNHSLNIWKV